MRRRRAERRDVLPDPKYNSKIVSKFINIVMVKGKKSLAEKIVYRTLDLISEKAGKKDPLEVFQKALDNARPVLEVRPRRVGGATYQIPMDVGQERGISIVLRWIRNFAKQKKGKPMEERLAGEILDAYKGEGAAIKKRGETHKMAEANKAFAHYRW